MDKLTHRLDQALTSDRTERAALTYYRQNTFATTFRAGRYFHVDMFDRQDPFGPPVYTLTAYLPDWAGERLTRDPHGAAIVQGVRAEHLDPNPEG